METILLQDFQSYEFRQLAHVLKMQKECLGSRYPRIIQNNSANVCVLQNVQQYIHDS